MQQSEVGVVTAVRLPPITGPRSTTLIEPRRLAEWLGVDLTIASEAFQYTGSFKFRAAYNVARSVPNPSIISASSGNFGQALALACKLTGKGCTVVMPDNSAKVKIDGVRSHGAIVDLVNTRQVPREARVRQLALEDPDAYVASAYDDPYVIQGNASLGHELAALHPAFDCVVVPIGGGGLASGLVTGLRARGSKTAVIAAEPEMANDVARSMLAGSIVVNDVEPQTIADGARTRSVGKHNWEILRTGLDHVVQVKEEQITETMRMLFSLVNLKAEPTGALAVAALVADPERFAGRRVCCVVTGGNVDPALYAAVLAGER
jgi:threo-3-hydroxy-L-aspartate ammonia-lyase